MKKAFLFLSIITASCLVGVTIYNTIIDAKSWGADVPNSIQAAREYYKHVDPRNFYLIFGPINQLLTLIVLILSWKNIKLRIYFASSFILYALIIILTITYFVPRDLILFTQPIQGNIQQLKNVSTEWSNMNWVRTLLGLSGILCSFKAIDLYYKKPH